VKYIFLVSRLCSTSGCIRDDHVVIESTSISASRLNCPGIIVVLRPYGSTTAKRVFKIQACDHGTKHPDAGGDFLRYSCRNIQVMIMDEVSMAYLDNIHNNNSG
jgi:hypothetical protein